MSFVCPNCNYRDDPRWHNRHFDAHAQIMSLEDFRALWGDTAKKLEDYGVVEEGPYVYGITKNPKKKSSRFVVRLTVEDFVGRGKSVTRVNMEGRRKGYWKRLWKEPQTSQL